MIVSLPLYLSGETSSNSKRKYFFLDQSANSLIKKVGIIMKEEMLSIIPPERKIQQ